MEAMEAILLGLAGMVLFFGPIVALKVIRSRRRTRALRALAPQMGFTFTGEVPPLAQTLQRATRFFGKGTSNRVENVMEGSASGMLTLLFDYVFDQDTTVTDGEAQSGTSRWTVAAFSSSRHFLPAFALERKRVISQIENRFKVMGDPEFGKRFSVGGQDQAAISSLISPQLIHFLLSTNQKDKWIVEGGGSWLLFHHAKPFPAKKWNGFLQEASQFAAGFFQNAAQSAAGANCERGLEPSAIGKIKELA